MMPMTMTASIVTMVVMVTHLLLPGAHAASLNLAQGLDNNNQTVEHHRLRRATDCTIPDDLAQRFRNLQAGGSTGNTFYLIPPEGTQSIYSNGAYAISGLEPYYSQLYTGTTCPTSVAQTGNLQDRSTCPWSYFINHDYLRYPRDLAEAKCRCHSCIGDSSGLNLCHPVKYNMRVLKAQDCVDGLWQYEADWQELTVGCTCGAPN